MFRKDKKFKRRLIYAAGTIFVLAASLFATGMAEASSDKEYVVLFRDRPGISVSAQMKSDRATVEKKGGQVEKSLENITAMTARLSSSEAEALKNTEDVLAVEENFKFKLDVQSMDWGISKVKAPAVWNAGYQGSGVKVAVIDSGISPHYDLNIKGGIDLVPDGVNSYSDGFGHGTHVAGIIAGLNNTVGYVGAAPSVDLYAVKVFGNSGYTDLSYIISAIDWCITNDMDIVNMSFGASDSSLSLETVVKKAYDSGLVLVAASGNDDDGTHIADTVNYPARYSQVIAVGAIDKNNLAADFSSSGPSVEVAAPGVDIISTYTSNDYAYASGTSMASPYVSGIMALYKQLYPTATNQQLRNMLIANVTDLGTSGRDNIYGYGLAEAPIVNTLNFTDFVLPDQTGPAVIDNMKGEISVKVSADANLGSQVATYEVSPGVKSVSVGGAVQTSGTTSNDFSSTVVYRLESLEGIARNWSVKVVKEAPDIWFRGYIQAAGWSGWKNSTQYSGAYYKRIEAIQMDLKGYEGVEVQYQTYVTGAGWQNWSNEGEQSGIIGKGVEMMRVRLTGAEADKYDVYYRVYTRAGGWLGWARNGQAAGYEGYARSFEIYQVRLVPKGTTGYSSTNHLISAYGAAGILRYSGYTYGLGWKPFRYDGQAIGYLGRPLQAYRIRLGVDATDGLPESGGITYQSLVAGVGWQAWKSNGSISGVPGRRMEVVRMKLTGKLAETHDVWYRVYVRGFGWMGWAKNGTLAGSYRYSRNIEAMAVKLVRKGAAAPGSTYRPYAQKY